MNYKIWSFLYLFLSVFIYADDNEQVKTDILFLKIQELELEIANLRNKVESQDYLIAVSYTHLTLPTILLV